MKTFGQKFLEEQQTPNPTLTFGNKVKKQVGIPGKSPFHIGTFKFQSGKQYYLNIAHGGTFRHSDAEEALERFIEYTQELKQKGKEAGFVSPPPPPANESAEFALKSELDSVTPDYYSLIQEVRRELNTAEKSPVKRSGSVGPRRRPIRDTLPPGREKKIEAEVGPGKHERGGFPAHTSKYDVEHSYPRQGAPRGQGGEKDITGDVNSQDRDYPPEPPESQVDVEYREDFHPFKKDGSIDNFIAWVNVIQNHMVEAARNNVGVYPYVILQEYIDARGVKDDPSDADWSMDVDDIRQVGMFDSVNVVEEQDKPIDTPDAETPERAARRDRRARVPYQHAGRIRSVYGKGRGKHGLLHVTSKQVKRFHKDMIDYFIKPGYILYMTRKQYDDFQQRGGFTTNLMKQIGKEIMSAGDAKSSIHGG